MKPFTKFEGEVIGDEPKGLKPQRRCELYSEEDDVITGTILAYGGSSVPSGYLDCDGSAVSRTIYAALFSAIGTTWGAGDGSTTFNLPDLRGRAVIGSGQGSGLTNRPLAETGGTETHTLATSEIPGHTHSALGGGNFVASNAGGGADLSPGTGYQQEASTASTGGGDAHQNMMPFAVVKAIIKT